VPSVIKVGALPLATVVGATLVNTDGYVNVYGVAML
jgi:hypothetical protein